MIRSEKQWLPGPGMPSPMNHPLRPAALRTRTPSSIAILSAPKQFCAKNERHKLSFQQTLKGLSLAVKRSVGSARLSDLEKLGLGLGEYVQSKKGRGRRRGTVQRRRGMRGRVESVRRRVGGVRVIRLVFRHNRGGGGSVGTSMDPATYPRISSHVSFPPSARRSLGPTLGN